MNTTMRRGLCFEVVRVTIQTTSPMSVGTGGGDDIIDHVCVTDANGLPAIPGSTLAGLLRSALAGGGDPDQDPRCRAVFGYQDRNEGASSTVLVSWAQVHDSQDRPVPFRDAKLHDPVLSFLAQGVVRDHVRVDAAGVVDKAGKFDEGLVPTGARFTFELFVHDGGVVGGADLVALLASRVLRMGGRTRSGLGSFRVERASHRHFDLRKEDDRSDFARLPVALHKDVPHGVLEKLSYDSGQPLGFGELTLYLTADDTLLAGTGDPAIDDHMREDKRGEHSVDKVPYTEQVVSWTSQGGSVKSAPRFVLAGSSIKGALRHRALFHAHRLGGHWSFLEAPRSWDSQDVHPARLGLLHGPAQDATDRIFGRAKSRVDGREEDMAGRVWVDDVVFDAAAAPTVHFDHLAIDRFTGGPMDGRLFDEAPIIPRDTIQVQVTIDMRRRRSAADNTGAEAAELLGCCALKLALDDLCQGRLALGAAASRGHGFFTGEIEDHGCLAWLERDAQ